MAVDSTFYDDNWTVLQKLIYLAKWSKENTVDLKTIKFTVTIEGENATVVASGNNFKGDEINIGTFNIPNIKGEKGDTGEQGERGEKGNGIVSINTLSHTVVGNETVNTIQVVTDDNTIEFEVHCKNGEKGDKGDKGDKGTSSIIYNSSQNATVMEGGYTVNKSFLSPLTIPTINDYVIAGIDIDGQTRKALFQVIAYNEATETISMSFVTYMQGDSKRYYTHNILVGDASTNIMFQFLSDKSEPYTMSKLLMDMKEEQKFMCNGMTVVSSSSNALKAIYFNIKPRLPAQGAPALLAEGYNIGTSIDNAHTNYIAYSIQKDTVL